MSVEDNAELEERLSKLSDRKLTLFAIWEIRSVRSLLTNHLHSHEKADERRWKIYLLLAGCFLSIIGGCVIALLV